MDFLNFTKVFAITLAFIALPFWLVGFGLLISIPLLIFAFFLERLLNPKPNNKGRTQPLPKRKMLASIFTFFAGIACFYGLMFAYSFRALNSDPPVNVGFAVVAALISLAYTSVVLYLINRIDVRA